MKKVLSWFYQFKYYMLFAVGIMGFKVYADYNNINIWPSSNETQADSRHSAHGRYFYRGAGVHHK